MGKPRVPDGVRAPAPVKDVALVLDRTDDPGGGYRVLRHRASDNQVELGTMRPLKEGRPIDGEVISLSQRQDMPFLYDVKTELADPRVDPSLDPRAADRRPTSDGPAQIATDDYRRGWDAIWGLSSADKPN